MGLFKDKKRWNLSKIVLLRCFSTIRMLTIIPKYHGGTMSHCTSLDLCPTVQHLQFFDVMLWWCNHIIKWSHICFKVVPIDKMIFPHWKPTFGGLYQAFRSILCFSVNLWHTFRKPNFWGFSYNQREDLDFSFKICNTLHETA